MPALARRLLCGFCLLGLVACAADLGHAGLAGGEPQTPAPEPAAKAVAGREHTTGDLAAQSKQVMQELQAAIGDAACDTDQQCHTVGVGAKPCGGPQGYLAWSDRGAADASRINALAERHRALQKAENERSGLLSNCRFAPDPGAVCLPRAADAKRHCALLSTARSGAV